MLNIRRFIIFLLFLFCLPIVIAGCLFYFFSIDDYSKWISEQVKQETGYDIRFEVFESDWLKEKKLSVLGVSLYQQNSRVIFIDRIDITIENLDLWSRHLAVKKLHLSGIELDIKVPINKLDNQSLNNHESPNASENKSIKWKKLQLAHFKITDMNANVQYLDKTLSIKRANFNINDVLIIENNQLVTLPKQMDMSTRIEHLDYKDEKLRSHIHNVNLSTQGNLLKRNGELDLMIDEFEIEYHERSVYVLNSLFMKFAMTANTLSLKQLSMNAFSGLLSAQAEAIFSFDLLPQPEIKIASIQINTLNAQNMDMALPNFSYFNKQANEEVKPSLLPIESLIIKQMNFQNMSLNSDHKKWPLIIKSADFQIENFQVIKDNKFWNINSEASQTGNFSIAFSELSWQDVIVEQFSLESNLEDSKEDFGSLKLLLD
jgi:hypothetical protein